MGKEVTGTRNRIAQLLRKRTYTVEDLARELGVTENAIRAQIARGIAEIEEEGKKLIIKGYGCPLAEAVASHARICVAMESLMSELIGVPVRQRCDRGETPSCRFEVDRE